MGMGSTFWFTVPFAKQAGVAPSIETSAGLDDLKVLIVDGQNTSRRILSKLLGVWRCRCDEAADGSSAIEKLRHALAQGDPFRLILLDTRLPDMDGEDLARIIKAEKDLNAPILVMLGSCGSWGDVARFEQTGFRAYLTKPIKQGVLYHTLAAAVDRRTADEKGLSITPDKIIKEHMRLVRILLAEDDPINQTVAVRFLEKLGYRADVVTNGIEAIKALETTPYDLVLMDVQMPDMDGIEATRIIRSPRSRVLDHGVGIVALTAHAMKGDKERCLEAGMDDYLSKPVQLDELMHAIERFKSGSSPKPMTTAASEECMIFDRAGVLKRLGGDGDFLKELFNMCLREMPRQIAALKDALACRDAKRLEREAHSLKGAADNIGAMGLKAAALDMELAAKRGDLESTAGVLDKIGDAFALFRQCLDKI